MLRNHEDSDNITKNAGIQRYELKLMTKNKNTHFVSNFSEQSALTKESFKQIINTKASKM